ncbi:MAG TPA: hypothetical protein VMJ70_03620 [Candidatus Sulfotelmatobacter sp.]|nr:hypothetical protein [Candidatus Sulfotelmatobacter sp.]
MQRIRYSTVLLAVGCALAIVSAAYAGDGRSCPGATPNPNGANIATRVFNDCPTSTLNVNNLYPASIFINDQNLACFGYANLHTWSFSTDGGATKAQFENCSAYRFCADVVLDGDDPPGEAGLRLAPWWSPDADGKFMLNYGTGEIACFGGRLPFYSFTAAYGIHYVRNQIAHMQITYLPNGLSSASPATIQYDLVLGGTPYSSGPIAFDSGNMAEDPPHGLWGELVPAYAGGYFQPVLDGSGNPYSMACTWMNICYEDLGVTPAKTTTWGKVKTLYR